MVNIVPTVVAYPPGAGGVRLTKKLCNSASWNRNPGSNSHHGESDVWAVTHLGYPKYPEYKDLAQLEELDIKHPILAVHSLHGKVISKLFPRRRIVKVQASFYKSLCRWWYVGGKEICQAKHPEGWPNMSHCQHAIEFHAEYYQTNIDTVCNECLKIEPGQSNFADFMLEEFEFEHDSEFDDAWHRVLESAKFPIMQQDVLTCSK